MNSKLGVNTSDNKVFLLAIMLFIFLSAGVISYLVVFKNSYESVMSFSSESSLNQAAEAIGNRNIKYRTEAESNTLYVEEDQLSIAREILGELGFSNEASVGLEIFATSDFGVTEFAQKVNYKRALEGELVRTISALSEIKHARVHLVLPERRVFDKNKESEAAVTVFLKKGSVLTPGQVYGIQKIVSSSVPSMSVKNVSILDQNGFSLDNVNVISSGMNSKSQYREKRNLEADIKNKISDFLSVEYLGSEFSVAVNVDLTKTSTKIVENTILPLKGGKGALLSSDSNSVSSTDVKNKSSTRNTKNQYKYGSRSEEKIIPPGVEKRISVAVFIPIKDGANNIDMLKEAIKAVAGLDPKRGDILSIIPRSNVNNTSYEEETRTVSVKDQQIPDETKEISNSFYIGSYGVSYDYLLLILVSLSLTLLLIIIYLYGAKRLSRPDREIIVEKIRDWQSD